MIFQNEKLVVRPLRIKDQHLLFKWLSNPKVLKFYEGRDNPFDIEMVEKKFYNRNDETTRAIFEFAGTAIGYIQFYPLTQEDTKVYGYSLTQTIFGIDQFIGETLYWNKGIGQLLVKSIVNFLFLHKEAELVVLDPQTQNERAIKCYERCGFEKVKLLPKRELHEGEYRDCWLMECKPKE
ncbi:GNAT family N-acetyltransferase [Bacillus carboniphilus]|uniref:GNAT family N-acetyltransferase n=1 Tax=Bacillus carboniphilus TaxID=86663 RepID=A0ABY9JXJ5_9BACI|nr:GNAT family N-acetyltransferase [Bacillus carboniphilus]WLR42391.1 GNAT family N-acetyltransferase [Bacillus carboniphilus]